MSGRIIAKHYQFLYGAVQYLAALAKTAGAQLGKFIDHARLRLIVERTQTIIPELKLVLLKVLDNRYDPSPGVHPDYHEAIRELWRTYTANRRMTSMELQHSYFIRINDAYKELIKVPCNSTTGRTESYYETLCRHLGVTPTPYQSGELTA